MNQCPLCEDPLTKSAMLDDRDMFAVRCRSCGVFNISEEAVADIDTVHRKSRPILSRVARAAADRGRPLEILTTNIRALLDEAVAAPKRESAARFQYDVALSFAGEDRPHADALASLLKGAGYSVFYDKYEQANLWGKNLYDHLANVYQEQARFCVIFVSAAYAKKNWTNHERQSAQARAFRERSEYILPIRLDETKIPGLPDTVAYLSLKDHSITDMFEALKRKLGAPGAFAVSPSPAASTTTSSGTAFFEEAAKWCAKYVPAVAYREVRIACSGHALTKFSLEEVRNQMSRLKEALRWHGLMFPQLKDREDIVRTVSGMGWHFDLEGYRSAYVLSETGSFLGREELLEAHEWKSKNRVLFKWVGYSLWSALAFPGSLLPVLGHDGSAVHVTVEWRGMEGLSLYRDTLPWRAFEEIGGPKYVSHVPGFSVVRGGSPADLLARAREEAKSGLLEVCRWFNYETPPESLLADETQFGGVPAA